MKRMETIQKDWVVFYSIESEEVSPEIELHCHSMCEFYYFVCGDVDYHIEGAAYRPTPDSLLLIPPNSFHGVKVNSKRLHRRYSVHFYPDILPQALRERLLRALSSPHVHYPETAKYRLEHFMRSILDCRQMPDDLHELALQSRLISLVTQVLLMEEQGPAPEGQSKAVIQDILQYLSGHIRENIRLDALAGRFYISKNHLNVLFREATGTTVCQYVRLKRLALAQQYMRAGMTASQSAAEAGFGDYSSFYRAFKAHFHREPTAPAGVQSPGDTGNSLFNTH